LKLKANKYTQTTKEQPLRLLAFNFKVSTDFGLILLLDFVVVSLLAFLIVMFFALVVVFVFFIYLSATKSSKRIRPKSVDTLKLKANKYTQTTKEQPLR
jgi:magnesium-transporting ATPase (P-type)